MTTTGRRAVRVVVSAVLLGAVFLMTEPGDLLGRLASLDSTPLFAALGLSVAQVVGSAWRWRFTAGRLGLDLPMTRAVPEYYLATFLNQVLPGGVVGDVSRAWRHAGAEDVRASVEAVAFERLSGLLVMSTVAVLSAVLLLPDLGVGARAGLVFGVAALLGAAVVAVRRLRDRSDAPQVLRDMRRALIDGMALPVQLATSAAVVCTYVAVFVLAGRAIQVEASSLLLAMLAAPVLMTMLVPLTVAGWGLREAAAAGLWGAVGLSPVDGVAVSVAYGLIVLASSLPGAVVLVATPVRGGGPDRRGDPTRAGSGAPEGDEPGRATRSREG